MNYNANFMHRARQSMRDVGAEMMAETNDDRTEIAAAAIAASEEGISDEEMVARFEGREPRPEPPPIGIAAAARARKEATAKAKQPSTEAGSTSWAATGADVLDADPGPADMTADLKRSIFAATVANLTKGAA